MMNAMRAATQIRQALTGRDPWTWKPRAARSAAGRGSSPSPALDSVATASLNSRSRSCCWNSDTIAARVRDHACHRDHGRGQPADSAARKDREEERLRGLVIDVEGAEDLALLVGLDVACWV